MRYILVRNPGPARHEREVILKTLEEELFRLKEVRERPTPRRPAPYSPIGPTGLISRPGRAVIPFWIEDRKKTSEEERLDGKYLIRTSDDTLHAYSGGYPPTLLLLRFFRIRPSSNCRTPATEKRYIREYLITYFAGSQTRPYLIRYPRSESGLSPSSRLSWPSSCRISPAISGPSPACSAAHTVVRSPARSCNNPGSPSRASAWRYRAP